MNATFDPATNRMIGVPHDNNGNVLGTTGTGYDFENRTVTWDGAESYGYAPDNRRVSAAVRVGGLTVGGLYAAGAEREADRDVPVDVG